MSRDESRVDMTTGSIAPKLFHLSWPLVVGNLLQTAYNLADMIWVGRVGAEAVAAISLMFPLSFLFFSSAMGLSAGSVALVSQYIGAGRERDAENAVAQSVLLALAVGAFIAAFGFTFRHWFVRTIGARGLVFDLSLAYIEVIFVSIPFTFLFFVFRSVLRAAGDTKTAMWLMAVSAGLNVVIDPFFVLGSDPLFGTEGLFLGLGVRGAAIATLISRIVATAVGIYILLDGGWGIRLRIRDLTPDVPELRKLVRIGYPSTIDGLLRSVGAVTMAAIVARYGAIVTAAYGIGLRLMSVSWTTSRGIGQAAATGVGQNLGADTPDRAERVAWTGTGGAMAILLAMGVAVFLAPGPVMRVFIADEAVIETGVTLLRIVSPFWLFMAGLQVLQGSFRGAGHTKQAMALSLVSRWALRIPLALLLPTLLGLGATGLWWAMAVSQPVAFLIAALWFKRGHWKEGVVEREGSAAPIEPDAEADSGTDAPIED